MIGGLVGAVVGRFLGDLHVVHMRFTDAGGGDLDELGLVVHLGDRGAAAVAHGGAHATSHLEDDADHAALVGHAAFDALGHQLVGVGVAGGRFLEVAIRAALLHGADGAHAAVALVAAALVEDDLARRFLGAGKHAAHHDGRRACGDGLGNVAREADTAVGNQGHARALERLGHAVDGHDLRHAHTGDDARGADRARADADLDGVGTGFDQRQRSRAGGDVAADHVHLRVVLLDPAHAIDHALAVAVRGVHDDGIDPGLDQGGDAFLGARTHTHGGGHAQAPLAVARGVGEGGLLVDVLDGDQALQFKGVVHHQETLQLVLV